MSARRLLAAAPRTTIFWQLVALVSTGVVLRRWVSSQESAELILERWGVLAPLLAVGLQALTATTPAGSSLIPIVNGAVFPLALAFTCNLAGAVLGATAMYGVWRRGEREIRIERVLERLPSRASRFARADFRSLLALRLLPWAGGNLANLLAGARGVPLRTHVLATLVSSLPGSMLYALVGAGVTSL